MRRSIVIAVAITVVAASLAWLGSQTRALASPSWQALETVDANTVTATAIRGSGSNLEIYATGYFTTIGGVSANAIAVWKQSANGGAGGWSALGSGLQRSNDSPGDGLSMAFGPDGKLYVGGTFAKAGGVVSSNVAAYDPSSETWEALGGGVHSSSPGSGYVYSFAFDGHHVYVGGQIGYACPSQALCSSANAIQQSNLARWERTTRQWSQLGVGVFDIRNYVGVKTMAVDGDYLFVGGGFEAVCTRADCAAASRTSVKSVAFLYLRATLTTSSSSEVLTPDPWTPVGGSTGGVSTGAGSIVNASVMIGSGADRRWVIGGQNLTSATDAYGTLTISDLVAWNPNPGEYRFEQVNGGVSKAADQRGVESLAVDSQGRLYVGGFFTCAGTASNTVTSGECAGDLKTPVYGIASIQRTSSWGAWQTVGSGAFGPLTNVIAVRSLSVTGDPQQVNGALVAGGNFAEMNGDSDIKFVGLYSQGGSSPSPSPTPTPTPSPTPTPTVDPAPQPNSGGTGGSDPSSSLGSSASSALDVLQQLNRSVSSGQATIQVGNGVRSAVPATVNGNDAVRVAGAGWSIDVARSPALTSQLPAGSPLVIAAGGGVRITAGGFSPGSTLLVALQPSGALLGSLKVDADGRVDGTVGVPSDSTIGDSTLQVAGILPGPQAAGVAIGLLVERSAVLAPRAVGKVVMIGSQTDSARLSSRGQRKVRTQLGKVDQMASNVDRVLITAYPTKAEARQQNKASSRARARSTSSMISDSVWSDVPVTVTRVGSIAEHPRRAGKVMVTVLYRE